MTIARRAFGVLLGLVVAQTALAAAPGQGVEAWLERMGHALQTLNYQGTFVYFHDDTLETMRVIHKADKNGGVERLVSLNGSAREIIRDHDAVKCILPDSRSVLVEKRPLPAARFPSSIPNAADTKKLEGHYKFVDLGHGRIAGYECQVIGVRPRDGFRYGYRLWLDEKTAMLLRSDLVSERGRTVEQVMFTSLTMPKTIPDSELKPAVSGEGFVWHVQGEKEKPGPAETNVKWEVDKLPPGYHLTLDQVQHLAGAEHPVHHLIYSDGLASVSVFAEPLAPGKPVLRGVARMGAVNAFGRIVGKHHVTVVGEVPAATVRMIGESVRLRDAGGNSDDH